MTNKAYCEYCDKRTEYEGVKTYCKKCGHEIYVGKYDDANTEIAHKIYIEKELEK